MATRSMEKARMPELLFVPCKIEHGGFSSERTFAIDLGRGQVLHGTANIDYLLDGSKRTLGENYPAPGEKIDGFVACRKIQDLPDGAVLIEVPGEYVIDVKGRELVTLD